MNPPFIPLNRPTLGGNELAYMREALDLGQLAARGDFSRRVEQMLESQLAAPNVLLTASGTAALEIAALLTVVPGDEVILPSFTYATTASAFARCGATLVFVDIDPDTLNIDPGAVAAALSPRTRAIVGVHYAGAGCDVEALQRIAAAHDLALIEDAAQGYGATLHGRPLGTFGMLAALSFHETKNVISGEGGALIVNEPALIGRAEIILNRGTNRAQFLRGERNEYNWMELGSAFAPSEIIAAFLLAQVEQGSAITAARRESWDRYHRGFAALDPVTEARRPIVSDSAGHNGHIYYLLIANAADRATVLTRLHERGIGAAFHYIPLHATPAGRKYGRIAGSLAVTEDAASRIIRLPLYRHISIDEQQAVIDGVLQSLIR
jgi:dTDP-4-amino-4,6-dideoxygalactose transaminase